MSFVTLIRPPMVVVRLVQSRSTCPPIGLAYLASSLREEGHSVSVIDAVGESIFQMTSVNGGRNLAHGLTVDEIADRVDSSTEILGVSAMFSIEWPLAYEVIRKLKKRFPGKPLICGGEHVTASADWIIGSCPEVDYCVLGEGETALNRLVGALSSGKPVEGLPGIVSRNQPKPKREGAVDRRLFDQRIREVDDIPLPAWDLIPLREYLDHHFGYGVDRGRNMPMLATRGCPYQCTFCSSPQMWSTRWVARKPEKVLGEMETYIDRYGAENFSFYDLTAIVKKEWIVEFCRLILERGHRFTWQLPSGTRSEAIDEEVAALLNASGCRNLNYAPESGSPSVLKRIKKKVNLETMKDSMKACLKNGMVIKSNTILGFPGERHREIWQTMRFLASLAWMGVHETTISGYIPYPGTEIYDALRASGRISEFSDEYFWSLATTSNIFKSVSWSERVSHRALAFYRAFGLLLFYTVSFLRRPGRFWRPLLNVLTGRKEESRMEASLRALFRKVFRHAPAP
jgi:radical SAM superfamily enzyme YgiQ (UPF0313 family)